MTNAEHLVNLVSRLSRCSGSGLLMAALCGLLFAISNFLAQLSMVPYHSDSNSFYNNIKGYSYNNKNAFGEGSAKEAIPALEVVFVRCCSQCVLLMLPVIILKLNIMVEKGNILSALLMTFSGYFAIVFCFLALERIPLSDALVISFTSPVFAALFSLCILKETCHPLDTFCGIVSFLGVVLVARPSFIFGKDAHSENEHFLQKSKTSYLIGAAFALLGGICLGLYFVMARKMNKECSIVVTILYPSILGVLVSPIIIYVNGERFVPPSTRRSSICVVSVGVFSLLGLALLVLALRLESSFLVSLIRNLDLVYAFLLQYFGLGVIPSVWSVGGGSVIICATTCMAVRRYLTSAKEEKIGEYDRLNSAGKDEESEAD